MSAQVAFHVDQADDAVFQMALGNINHTLASYTGRGEPCTAHLVLTGPAVLRLATLPDAMQLTLIDLVRRGLLVEPCRNAMAAFHVTDAALPDYVQPVPAGIVRLIELQQAGSAYIRP